MNGPCQPVASQWARKKLEFIWVAVSFGGVLFFEMVSLFRDQLCTFSIAPVST